jgi:hypothetical protein
MKKVSYSDYLFIINVGWGDRWQTYHRLTELEIPCKCSTGKVLEVIVNTPTAALQVWSVGRQQLVQPRQMINWLEQCLNNSSQEVAKNMSYE